MGLIAEIKSLLDVSGGKPAKRVADAEAALQRLAAKREAARQSIAALMKQREQALRIDGSDKKVAELDATADHHRLTIERLELLEPELVGELQARRTEQKRQRWRELRARHSEAALAYAAALREALKKLDAMLAVESEARGQGFESEATAAFAPPARIVGADAVAEFEIAVDRQRDAQVAMESPSTPAPPAFAKVTALAAKAPAKPAPALKAVPPAPKLPPRAPIVETAGEGETAVVIIRSGLEAKGQRWIAGDQIALSSAEAEAMLRSGAVTLPDGARVTWGAA
jgi:hypothetical protein